MSIPEISEIDSEIAFVKFLKLPCKIIPKPNIKKLIRLGVIFITIISSK